MNKNIRYILRSFVASVLVALVFIAGAKTPAMAASCQAIAAQVAASQGGTVLSASARGNKCTIKILVKSKKGPPKRKTIVVSM